MNLLKSHLSRKHHHAPEREGQLCPICGKKCYYTADLEIHIAVQHMGLALERPPKDEGEVMCHECGKVCYIIFEKFQKDETQCQWLNKEINRKQKCIPNE